MSGKILEFNPTPQYIAPNELSDEGDKKFQISDQLLDLSLGLPRLQKILVQNEPLKPLETQTVKKFVHKTMGVIEQISQIPTEDVGLNGTADPHIHLTIDTISALNNIGEVTLNTRLEIAEPIIKSIRNALNHFGSEYTKLEDHNLDDKSKVPFIREA